MLRSTRSKKERTQRSRTPQTATPATAQDEYHPSCPVMHNYCLYRERLSQEMIAKVEAHLAVCERCRVSAEDTISKADYFRRLDKAPIDC